MHKSHRSKAITVTSYQLFAARFGASVIPQLLSTPPVPPETAPPPPSRVPLPEYRTSGQRDTCPLITSAVPLITLGKDPERRQGLNHHAHRADSVCCLQLLFPALIVGLCRYSRIIHASLIKAVNSLIVKLENVQHLLSGNPVPGIGGGECQVCVRDLPKGALIWLFHRSVWHSCLILGARMMAKGSLVPGIQAQKGEATGIQGGYRF